MTRSLNFGNHLQVPHLLFFSQIPPLHLQRLLQLRISILFSTLPHHFCCLPPSPPSGQSLKQDWQSLQCFLLPYNSSVLVPILVALGPHWVPISLSGSLSIKISIHSLCSSICFLLSKDGICSRPRLMTILFHFLPSFFTLTIGKTVLETWHLRHWLQFWQLRTWIQTIILTWQLIVTLDSIRNSCDVLCLCDIWIFEIADCKQRFTPFRFYSFQSEVENINEGEKKLIFLFSIFFHFLIPNWCITPLKKNTPSISQDHSSVVRNVTFDDFYIFQMLFLPQASSCLTSSTSQPPAPVSREWTIRVT